MRLTLTSKLVKLMPQNLETISQKAIVPNCCWGGIVSICVLSTGTLRVLGRAARLRSRLPGLSLTDVLMQMHSLIRSLRG